MEDLKTTVAFLFKRKGRTSLSEKEFVFSASMDLRWFSPKDAQKLLDISIKKGLLSLKDGRLRPTFDLDEAEVPLDFAPSAEVLKEGEDLFKRMVDEISSASGRPSREVVSRINTIQARMGIYGEVAALLAGREMGVDMRPFIDDVDRLIRDRRPTPPSE
jgi:hypothetical protein